MTNRKIKLGIDWVIKKGETVDEVAKTFHVSSRRIEQLVKIFKDTGKYPILNPRRRPKVYLTEDQKQIIKQAYSESYFGAKMLRHHIKKRHKQNIPQNKIHAYLLEIGFAKPDSKKQKKRKRCRYERDHSLSLLHVDYMENEGIHVIAFEDDASRKILSIGEFNNATTDNALEILKIAEKEVMEVMFLYHEIYYKSQHYQNQKTNYCIYYFQI